MSNALKIDLGPSKMDGGESFFLEPASPTTPPIIRKHRKRIDDDEREMYDSRSASIALAVVRYLPIDGLVLIVAKYEELWIPSYLHRLERWYRRLNDRLTKGIFDDCVLCAPYPSKNRVAAKIVNVEKSNEGHNEIIVIVIDRNGKRYEMKPDCVMTNQWHEFRSLVDSMHFRVSPATQFAEDSDYD